VQAAQGGGRRQRDAPEAQRRGTAGVTATFATRFPRLRALEFAPSPAAEGLAFTWLILLLKRPLLALESIKVAAGPRAVPPAAESDLELHARRRVLDELAAAVQAGRCPALAAFDLDFCREDAPDTRALLYCAPFTRRLKRLGFSHCDMEAVAEALAAAAALGALPALAALRLGGVNDARALRALAAVPRWDALEEVDLGGLGAIGDAGGAALAGPASAPCASPSRTPGTTTRSRSARRSRCSPRRLRGPRCLSSASIQTARTGTLCLCAASAAAAPRLLALRELDLDFDIENDNVVEALASATWARLERLTLTAIVLHDEFHAPSAAAARFPALRALDFR
jgi:hypothetical protein